MNEQTPNEQKQDQTRETAEAPERAQLSPYEQWQARHDHLLMDGTFSQASYLRLYENEDIEYGVQVRLIPCDSHMHLAFRARCAYKRLPVTDPNQPRDHSEELTEDQRLSKVDGLLSTFEGAVHWHNVGANRLSRVASFVVPIAPQGPDAKQSLAQLKAILPQLPAIVLANIPAPASGYDPEAIKAYNEALVDYLDTTMRQFQPFKTVIVTNHDWDETPAAGEVQPEVADFVAQASVPSSFDPPPPGPLKTDEAENAQQEAGEPSNTTSEGSEGSDTPDPSTNQ